MKCRHNNNDYNNAPELNDQYNKKQINKMPLEE